MRLALVGAPVAALLACSSPSQPVTPPAPPANPHEIIDSFTRDVWPVIAAFNADGFPLRSPYKAFTAIMAAYPTSQKGRDLYEAASSLGYPPPESDRDGVETMAGNDGLHLRTVDVQRIQHDTADLDVCYTYTHYWSVRRDGILGDSQHAPGASEATFGLYNWRGTWMLSEISGDHVVPDCVANKA